MRILVTRLSALGDVIHTIPAVSLLTPVAEVSWVVEAPYAELVEKGEQIPSEVRRAISFGTAEDCAGLVVYLASDAASGVTGQCIGIGGDRLSLWSHPTEVRSVFQDGGWDADDIATVFSTTVGETPETYGIAPPDFG